MSVKIHGLDELQNELKKLSRNMKKLEGEHSVSLSELMPPSFVNTNSRFQDIDALFDASGYSVETEEDFEAIPEDVLDKFISENTNKMSPQNETAKCRLRIPS